VSNKPKIWDFHKLKPIPLMQNFDHWGIYFIRPFVLENKKTLSICNYGHRSIHEVSRRSNCWIDNCVRSYKFSFEKILCHYGCLVHTSFDPGAHFFANTYNILVSRSNIEDIDNKIFLKMIGRIGETREEHAL
jgi:hypothetical protein